MEAAGSWCVSAAGMGEGVASPKLNRAWASLVARVTFGLAGLGAATG